MLLLPKLEPFRRCLCPCNVCSHTFLLLVAGSWVWNNGNWRAVFAKVSRIQGGCARASRIESRRARPRSQLLLATFVAWTDPCLKRDFPFLPPVLLPPLIPLLGFASFASLPPRCCRGSRTSLCRTRNERTRRRWFKSCPLFCVVSARHRPLAATPAAGHPPRLADRNGGLSIAALQVGGQDAPPETRRRLLSLLLASLSPSSSSPHSTTLTPSSPASLLEPTLSLIKLLGRSPAGSEELGRERGLSILLAYGGLSRVATSLPPRVRRQRRRAPQVGLGIVELDSDDDGEEEDEALVEPERDPLTPAEAEALKCLCNTLTLHPSARDLFPHVVLEDRTWVQGMVRLLAVQGAAFLAGRLLFLLTSKPGEMVTELTEQGEVIGALEEVSFLPPLLSLAL